MKKVTSLLIAAFTTVAFAGSAMAATPAHHAPEKAKTHQTHKQHKASHSVKAKASPKTAAPKAAQGTTTPATK